MDDPLTMLSLHRLTHATVGDEQLMPSPVDDADSEMLMPEKTQLAAPGTVLSIDTEPNKIGD